MISRVEWAHGRIYVHLAEISQKNTKSFTHGSVTFDRTAGTVVFGSLPPVAFPPETILQDGQTIELQLVAPDGTFRKQTRNGMVREIKKGEIYRIGGQSKTPAKFPAEDGWTIEVFKYRAYINHPGLNTTGTVPDWLCESIERQRRLWNHLAWRCREARRKCSPVPDAEIDNFVKGKVLPTIANLNDTLGSSREKLKAPAKLMADMPTLDSLWQFVGLLRKRIKLGLPVPEGLLESIIAFANSFKSDYAPIHEFLANVNQIGAMEAHALGMLRHEIRPTLESFKTVLKLHRTRNKSWSEGWPLIKYPDSPKASNWALSYYLNESGVKSDALERGKGIPGLQFGPAKPTTETGHSEMIGVASQRALREATIALRNLNKEPREFRFGVLQHRPLPKDSHIKQWQLAETNGKLWLNLTVEVKRPMKHQGKLAAGLDIGWRRSEEGIRIGVLYEPSGKSYKEIHLDFQISPKDPTERVPFRINLGPTRWERRNIHRLIPDWKPGDTLPGTLELRRVLSSRRTKIMDQTKIVIRQHLGENVPAWLDKAGKRGILSLAAEMRHDTALQEIIHDFSTKDSMLGQLTSEYLHNSTLRMEYGYEQIAHDICRHIGAVGLTRIAVEESFLKEAMRPKRDKHRDYYALKNSQKYRQFAAVGKFITILRRIVRKYGFTFEEVAAANTSRTCHRCGHLNPGTDKQIFECEKCYRLIDQDYNAAVNLSRAGS